MAKVLWFTGLSGSGKTTIVDSVVEILKQKGKKIKILDGDDVRAKFHTHLGFSVEDIKENNRLITLMCLEYMDSHDYVFVPIISPFIESRAKAKQMVGEFFKEIHIKCSLDECIRRDVKGHYKKALAGEIENFIGVAKQVPYEPPVNPDLVLDTENKSIKEVISELVSFLD
jgi:adenylyl-sulfate kinase